MPPNTLKRNYSRAALEGWFHLLLGGWERFFSEQELSEGRTLYRNGATSEIELSPSDAIIHLREGRDDFYVVVDWEGTKPQVRFSREDRKHGRALAVAGLYEIEELVADEVEALAPIPKEERSAAEIDPAPQPEAIPCEPARELILQFSTRPDSLRMQAYWRTEGGALVPAYKKPSGMAEREALIRLSSLSRRAGFHADAGYNAFYLKDLDRVPGFIRNDLKNWKRYATIELDEEVKRLRRGIREAELEARAAIRSEGMDVDWAATVDGRELQPGALRQMRKGAVILPGVGLVHLSERKRKPMEQWREIEATFQDSKKPRYLLFSLFENVQLSVTPQLQQWRDSLFKEEPQPKGLPKFLRNYQAQGVRWLQHMLKNDCHALLADEMGLGKTVQVLTLIANQTRKEPALVVCPASVAPVWQGEANRFFPKLRVEVLRSGNDFSTTKEPPDVWVTSYTQLRRHERLLGKVKFSLAILDEAQFIKNPDAKSTQACLKINATSRIAMTGTPLENHAQDIWTVFRFLMPGLLGTRAQFLHQFAHDEAAALKRLRTQIKPFMLRRTKKSVARELPDKVEITLDCPLTDTQRSEYSHLSGDAIERFGETIEQTMQRDAMSLLTVLTRLRQVCCDPALLPWISNDTAFGGKITILLTKLEEAASSGRKVVIFSQFVSFLGRIRTAIEKELPALPIYELTGSTTNRQEPVDKFQNSRKASVMLVSLRAGGTGITLHSADYVFLMDPWWNPAVEQQAIDRVHRIGQRNTVLVYRMVAPDTVEDRVNALKMEKSWLFDQAVGTGSSGAGFMQHYKSLRELLEIKQ